MSWGSGLASAGIASAMACTSNYRGGNDSGLDATVEDGSTRDANAAKDATMFGDAGVCTLPQFYSNACQPCANTNCCTQQQDCALDSDCSAYVVCRLKCGCPPNPCWGTCGMTHQAGQAKFTEANGLDACVSMNCGGTSCRNSCPSDAGTDGG